jgi:hypothetical protein
MKQATEGKPDQQGDSECRELRPFTLSANSVELFESGAGTLQWRTPGGSGITLGRAVS